jgi:hypothetical protein
MGPQVAPALIAAALAKNATVDLRSAELMPRSFCHRIGQAKSPLEQAKA